MKTCFECKAELTDDAKYCSYCGKKMEEAATPPPPPVAEEEADTPPPPPVVEEEADTPPPVVEEETDTPPPVVEEETDTPPPPVMEENETSDTSQNDQTKRSVLEFRAPKSLEDRIKEKAVAQWNELSDYGKFTTIFITLFALLYFVAFLFGKTISGIIAILQIILTVAALLMKKQLIRASENWHHLALLAFAVILLIPYVSLFHANQNVPRDAESISWPDIILGTMIPEPESHLGEIIGNTNETLLIYVYQTSAVDYNDYIDACKENGFTVKADQSDISYSAYNTEGDELSLFYNESKEVMNIRVDAAGQYDALE